MTPRALAGKGHRLLSPRPTWSSASDRDSVSRGPLPTEFCPCSTESWKDTDTGVLGLEQLEAGSEGEGDGSEGHGTPFGRTVYPRRWWCMSLSILFPKLGL